MWRCRSHAAELWWLSETPARRQASSQPVASFTSTPPKSMETDFTSEDMVVVVGMRRGVSIRGGDLHLPSSSSLALSRHQLIQENVPRFVRGSPPDLLVMMQRADDGA